MASFFRFFGLAASGYAALAGLLFLGQRRLMYHPATAALPAPAEVGLPGMRTVSFPTADGLDLLAWYQPAAAGRPTLVYYHGNAGHIGHRAGKIQPYLDAGYGVLLVSWRGYGGNPGSPDENGLYQDARGALDFLDSRNVPPDRVVVYGESLGSAVAVRMASERAVAAVVLEAPFTSIADVAQRHYWFLPAGYMVLDRFDSQSRIGDIRAPLLVLHGENDRVVPVDLGWALFEAAPEPKEAKFFARAGHVDLYDHGAGDAVLDFLARLGA